MKYTLNNKTYSDLFSLSKDMYLSSSLYAKELRNNTLLDFIKELDEEKYQQIISLSLIALPDDVFVFKVGYILNPFMSLRINGYLFDDYQKLGEKMISFSPSFDPILMELVSYSLLSEQMESTNYSLTHKDIYLEVKRIENIASNNHLLAYFMLAYYLSKKKTIVYKKQEYKNLYNFCYYLVRREKDLDELGSYLSSSPLLQAYGYYSKEKKLVEEYLHLCSELDKSEKKLSAFLKEKERK